MLSVSMDRPPNAGTDVERSPLGTIAGEAMSELLWSGAIGGCGLTTWGNVHRICHCEASELVRKPATVWVDHAHPADQGRIDEAWQQMLIAGTPVDEEYRWQRGDGTTVWIRVRAALRQGADAPIVDAVIADISERHALVDQIRHLQRIEVVGEFTGGLAHDFNNLLAIILANGTMLLDALPDGDPRRVDAVGAVRAAERAAVLTRQLLPFTRKHALEPRIVDLNDVVKSAGSLLRCVIGESIELTLRLAAEPVTTRADQHLLEQVLMNLVVNARDAMPGGGKLAIETSAAAGRVRLAVSDTGCGIDAATRARIFEPFFTTKARGKGTGLGLATSYGIVREAGGTISVDSEPGRGSVFEVLLPGAGAAQSTGAATAADLSPDYRGSEHILIVEDEDGVRTLVARLLQRSGYRVSCARDAQEALAAVLASESPIDLVLSDLILPQVNGSDVVRGIQTRAPRTKALFMSGHAATALIQKAVLREDQPFIRKPFTPGALVKRVREVLDA